MSAPPDLGTDPAGPDSGHLEAIKRGLLKRFRPQPAAQSTKALLTARPRSAAVVRAGLFSWVPVLLAAGIGLWFALPFDPDRKLYGWLVVISAFAAFVAIRAPHWAGSGHIGWRAADVLRLGGWAALLIAAGLSLAGWRAYSVAAPVLHFRYYGPIEGRVIEVDRSSRDRMRLTLDTVTLSDLEPLRTPSKVRVSLMEGAILNDPQVGQRVMLTGHLGAPPSPASPDSFDFRSMAWFEQLGAVGYARTPVVAVEQPEGGMWAMHRLRMRVSAQMQEAIGGQAGAVASALMTGDRSGISEATNELMRASNLYHIISISGLHMGMLAGFVYASLRLALVGFAGLAFRMVWPVHKMAACGALVAASAYLWLSGGGVGTERAYVMVAVMLVAILVDRRAISLRTIAIAATIILIYSPEALTSPGFQMSFVATIALVLTYGPWQKLSPNIPILLRPLAMLVLSSVIAGTATSPVAAAHFSRMAQYGLIANLLVVPVMGTLVMPAGVIAGLLPPLGLAGPALWVMGIGTKWMLYTAEIVAGFNGAVTSIPLAPWQTVPLMGFGAVLMVLTWRRRDRLLARVGTGLGAALLVSSFGLWVISSRPQILIAPEGEAVGIMTAEGRATSKPSGGPFVVNTWPLEDGDTASQKEAATRGAWKGDKRDHWIDISNGTGLAKWRLLHFTGKGAGNRAALACRKNHIVVVNETVTALPAQPDCLMFDTQRLKTNGAVAIEMTAAGPVIRTVKDAMGKRSWTQ